MNNHSEMERTTVEENGVNSRVSVDTGVGSPGEVSRESLANDEAGASTMELDWTGGNSGGDARVSGNERPEEVGGLSENDGNKEMKDRVSDTKSVNGTESPIETTEVKNEGSDDHSADSGAEASEKKSQMALKEERQGDLGKYTVCDYKSLLSEFDDYVASEKTGTGISRALSYGFQLGDLVWGKVKSHPWWPGHIFNEAFASSSVRRTRRIGYVLVAFFGDSSYGWFDPAELIPFEPHFPEKWQQTNAKTFVRAVEEAMDEAGRRSALGLLCKCRNPYNFRPTSVQGYFAVDVPDYDPQAIYSTDQIKNARESFSPVDALSFVKLLALAPQESDSNNIEFVKNRAMIYAFRRALYEEFDETYAQAFGAKSSRPSANSQEPHVKEPPRAPLSGPLVIAETLGDSKSSKKPVKAKDSLKQDKYLFKRRDEADDSRTVQFGEAQASSAASEPQSVDGSSTVDYVLQRRTLLVQTPLKHEETEPVRMDLISLSGDVSGQESLDLKSSEKGFAQESKEKTGEKPALFPGHGEVENLASLKLGDAAKHSESNEGFHKSGLEFSPGSGSHAGGVVKKKVKALKRSSGEMGSMNDPSELKKRKKKKELGSERNSEHPLKKKKSLSSGKLGLASGEDIRAILQKRDTNTVDINIRNSDLEVPQLLSDLQALALDPFFMSSNKRSSGTVRQFFLRFRSLVYQKSLVLTPPSDAAENAKDTKLSKATMTLTRTDDPTKPGKKRILSDHQEENAGKKLKKTNPLKPIALEKKTSQEQKTEGKEQSSSTPTTTKPVKPTKSQVAKKQAPPPKIVEPTMLVMKFPPGTSLPSSALLKARFGRFGMLDQSAIRVFWKSSTCRVVFLYKADAQTAFRYATGNNSLFGNMNVRYYLRDVETTPPAVEDKGKGDEPVKEPQSDWQMPMPIHQPILPPPNVQLKSCLKKPGDDTNGNGNRGTARVKFMLGSEEPTSRNNSFNDNNNNGNYADGGGPSSSSSSSSSVAMEFVSKNFQNVVPQSSLPPILSNPPYSSKPNKNNGHVEPTVLAPPRNFHAPSVDISQQMLSLLSRCNDVVTNVTGMLGYVPYHPL